MEKRSQQGPEALKVFITPMPKPEYVMLETNVNMATNADLLTALDAVTGVEGVNVTDPYTIALLVDTQVPKPYLACSIEDVVRLHCQS